MHFSERIVRNLQTATLLIVVSTLAAGFEHGNIVATTNGWVRGVRETTQRKQVAFVAFRGIPYAKPPLGELRLKAPEPADSWKPRILDATRYGNNCIGSNEYTSDPYPQSEDCLYLNVYVPAVIKPLEKLAVMTFIHGGAYMDGSGRDYTYGPDFLIENRVILVTMNYRLAVLGFLSLDLPEYSGNMGLKDQQLALKWVYKNIKRFGGDNKRITVFGESVGGSSTQFHLLSDESRKYFNRAIMLSGTAYNPFAFSPFKNHIDLAIGMVDRWQASTSATTDRQLAGNSRRNLTNLVETLKVLPVEVFAENAKQAQQMGRVFVTNYSAVYERPDAVEPFLVDALDKTYDHADITMNVMFGLNTREALTFDDLNSVINSTEDLQKQFDLQLPFNRLPYRIGSPRYQALDDQIRQFYFGNLPIDDTTRDNYLNLLSDMNFVYDCVKGAKIHSQKSRGKTFYYLFSVDSKLNVYKRMSSDRNRWGTAHRDDLCYLFRCKFAQPFYDELYSTEDDQQSQISLRTIDRITKIFTDFAKYGQPLINVEGINELPQFESINTEYLNISNDGLAIGKRLRKKVVDFWTDIEAQALA